MHEWVNYLNKSYMDLYGGKLKVFKLDKTATKMHELYLEESKSGRIYLTPIEMRGLFDDGKYRGSFGADVYSETQQPQIFFVNFENMVRKITDAKIRHVSNIYIKYSGQGVPYIKKSNNTLTIWEGSIKQMEYNLDDPRYSTIKKLAAQIQSFTNFKCELEGTNDLSKNIIDFEKTGFSGRQIMIYTEDQTFKNVTDVIEMGDAILTSKYRLYEVLDVAPAGETGWAYTTWKIECKLANVENFNLPGNYIEQIKENAYGLKTKIKME